MVVSSLRVRVCVVYGNVWSGGGFAAFVQREIISPDTFGREKLDQRTYGSQVSDENPL